MMTMTDKHNDKTGLVLPASAQAQDLVDDLIETGALDELFNRIDDADIAAVTNASSGQADPWIMVKMSPVERDRSAAGRPLPSPFRSVEHEEKPDA